MSRLPQVALSDDVLLRMMRDPNFTNKFPFLATTLARAENPSKGCGSCRRKNRTRPIDFGLVRRQVSELPPEKKLAIKQLLNTDQVVVQFQRTNGQQVKLKF
jgi:hypothetical protein